MRGLTRLLHYVDDVFSFDPNEELKFYSPYQDHYPLKQVKLLHLFDEARIPHKKQKQEFSQTLTIIGLEVSLESMTISMPKEKREELIVTIDKFVNNKDRWHVLQDWQRLLRYCNWGL